MKPETRPRNCFFSDMKATHKSLLVWILLLFNLFIFVVFTKYFARPSADLPKCAINAMLGENSLVSVEEGDEYESLIRNDTDVATFPVNEWTSNGVLYQEETVFDLIEEDTSLPLKYWLKRKRKVLNATETDDNCSVNFPNIYTLRFNNVYWQELITRETTLYLLSAFLDDRADHHPMIRIIVVSNKRHFRPPLCQIWLPNESQPRIFKSKVTTMYVNFDSLKKGYRYVSHLLSCSSPLNVVPEAVSLVEEECNHPENVLRVVYNKVFEDAKSNFGVCLRAVHFPFEDISTRVVEWMEFLKLMGVNKVHMHLLEVHPKVRQVLDYYQKQGFLEIRGLSLPGYQPNLLGLRHLYLQDRGEFEHQTYLWEQIPLNDCFYRNLYSYRFILVQDMDEILVPFQHNSYSEMVDKVGVRRVAFASFDTIEYHNLEETEGLGLPRYMHMLSRVYRKAHPSSHNSINNPRYVGVAHSHHPPYCFGERGEEVSCSHREVSSSIGWWQHYKMGPGIKLDCDVRKCLVCDSRLWRFKEQLTRASGRALTHIFIP